MTHLDQESRRVPRTVDTKGRVGKFDRIHNSFRREIVHIDVAVCPAGDEFVAGIPNGQERIYLRGVSDRQGRPRVSGLKVVVDVPNVNGVISSSGRKRKRLHHGANCGQPVGFSGYGGSVIGSNLAGLGGTASVIPVWQGGLESKNKNYRRSVAQPMDSNRIVFPTVRENQKSRTIGI
jgi:hypothetical protein